MTAKDLKKGGLNMTKWFGCWFGAGMGLLLAGCSAQSDRDALTAQMAQSMRVGEAAAGSRPAYGFELYPGAKVTSALMDGMSLSIRTDAGIEAIAAFYERQLIEKGWEIADRELSEGKVALEGVMPANRQELMNITVARAKSAPDQYSLIFLRLTTGG